MAVSKVSKASKASKASKRVARPASDPGLPSELAPAELWARYQPELRALSREQITKVTLDVPGVVSTILAALPRIQALRAELTATFRSFPFDLLDSLQDYTLVLRHAHDRLLTSAPVTVQISTVLIQQAKELRTRLREDVRALERRGLLDAKKSMGVRNTGGYRAIAEDLTILAAALRKTRDRSDIRGLTPAADVTLAVELSKAIKNALSNERLMAREDTALIDARARAFTLAVRAYAHVRRAIVYLRYERGDADQIAPSLYAGRDPERRKRNAERRRGTEA